MILGFVYKLLYGGCVTVTTGCILNCLLEHVAEFTVLSGPSMIPTFNMKQDGDLVITEHLSAQFRTIKKGDVVIVRSPENPRGLICKRIAAMSGERIRTGEDGKDDFKIPKGHVWLLGDNPNYSKDSRDYGPVPYGLIRGRACFKVPGGGLEPVWFGLLLRLEKSETHSIVGDHTNKISTDWRNFIIDMNDNNASR